MPRAGYSLPQVDVLRKTPGESFAQYDRPRKIIPTRLLTRTPYMSQNSHVIPKIRLVLEHTVANRAVFYCVHRETAGPKSANFGIKNRVGARSPLMREAALHRH
jgi:hypothetical protein